MSPFTRINVAAGVLAVSLAPLLAYWSRIRAGKMDVEDWAIALIGMVVIQIFFWHAPRRCSSDQLSYWRGVTVAAQCMRTGWTWLDMAIALVTLPPLLVASFFFIFAKAPSTSFHRLVHFYYQHRMEQ